MGRRLRSDPRLQELEAIYREHHRRVRWVLRSRGVDDDLLDDLVQEAFVAIFRRLPDRDPDLPMALWVTGIARNVAFSHRRSSARRIEASRKMPTPPPEIEPDEAVERRHAWAQLQTFLDGLDEAQREVFVLSDLLGMKVPEVADVVDAPLNTLYSRLRLARRRFNEHFGDDGAAQLERAGQGEAPSSAQRRQAWLAIAAQLPVAAAPTAAATGATTFVGLKWLLALGAVAGVATTVAVASDEGDEPPPVVAKIENAPDEPRPAPTKVEAPKVEPPQPDALPEPAPVEPPPRAEPASSPEPKPRKKPSTATEPPAASIDDAALVATVEALGNAKRELRNGNGAQALKTLDALASAHPQGPMQTERRRLERQAACAAENTARARSARDALARAGLADAAEPPCEKKPDSP